MRRRLCTAYIMIAALLGNACSGDVVAVVGKTPISRGEVEATAALFAMQRDPVLLSSREQQDAFTREVVETLIDQYLVQAAATAAGIRVTPEELTEYLDDHKGRYSDESFREMLAQRGIDESTWRTQRERQLRTERYIAEVIVPQFTVTDTAVANYYQAHREEFQTRDGVRARHILVADRATATTVRKRLLAGENFAQLATEFSIAPEAEQGGDLGWIERGHYPAVFEETCFRLPVGAMSDIVQSAYGFHLFKTLERRRATTRTLADATADITARLRHDASTEAFTATLATLRNATTLVIHDDAVERVVLTRAVAPAHAVHNPGTEPKGK